MEGLGAEAASISHMVREGALHCHLEVEEAEAASWPWEGEVEEVGAVQRRPRPSSAAPAGRRTG